MSLHTVKIRDSALGQSGFESFFWWAYLCVGGLIQGEFIVTFYGPILLSLLFLGGPICGGGYLRGGGAIKDFYGMQ